MLIECKSIHIPDYNKTCCYKHLIEMYDYAENQTLIHKYAKLFMSCLNHNYKLNMLMIDGLKLDMLKSLLNIITRVISHFYFLSIIVYNFK
jgi:hypothetical protein